MHSLVRFITVLLLAASASLAQAASISMTPSSLTVNQGQSFSLDINIGGVSDLYGFQVDLQFSPSLFAVNSVSQGTLLPSGGATLFFGGDIDNTAGTVSSIADSLTGPIAGVTGDGLLATISFTALASGSSGIGTVNAIFLDSLGNDIVIDKINTADVTVTPSAVTPIPAAVWLFGSALVSLVGVSRRKLG
ncbi:MAG: cohesin domain-containing protein [Methyloglobulus sp.]|nr:hypothetical protein [Methyloglobulus sp.]